MRAADRVREIHVRHHTLVQEQEIASEDVARRRFDKFWAQEEVWIRKGVEARRTRNEGRVKRLEQLRVDGLFAQGSDGPDAVDAFDRAVFECDKPI